MEVEVEVVGVVVEVEVAVAAHHLVHREGAVVPQVDAAHVDGVGDGVVDQLAQQHAVLHL